MEVIERRHHHCKLYASVAIPLLCITYVRKNENRGQAHNLTGPSLTNMTDTDTHFLQTSDRSAMPVTDLAETCLLRGRNGCCDHGGIARRMSRRVWPGENTGGRSTSLLEPFLGVVAGARLMLSGGLLAGDRDRSMCNAQCCKIEFL